MFLLELQPTSKCNQSCYYCNVHGKSIFEKSPTPPIVDINYLKFVLECHNQAELAINISGGEIGLLSNVFDFFNTIFSFSNVKQINIESNGLIRKLNFDFNSFPNTHYSEHLIFDIEGKEVKKFYDLDFERVNENHRFIIITTEKTIDSILNNFDYFKDNGFLESKFWYKIIVPKTFKINYLDKLHIFYSKIGDKEYGWELDRINQLINNVDTEVFRKFCAMNPPQPFIDFENQKLVHCGVVSRKCNRFPFTKKNVELNMKCSLFTLGDYCKNCYVYDYDKNKINCIIRSKKGNYCNRSYINR